MTDSKRLAIGLAVNVVFLPQPTVVSKLLSVFAFVELLRALESSERWPNARREEPPD